MTYGSVMLLTTYSPMADVVTVTCCIVFAILIKIAYINKSKSFSIFKIMLGLVFVAASIDLVYFIMGDKRGIWPDFIFETLYVLKQLSLMTYLFFYTMYIKKPIWLDKRMNRVYTIIASSLLGLFALGEILGCIFHMTFFIQGSKGHTNIDIFAVAYVSFVLLMYFMAFYYRERVVKQILWGFSIASGLAVVLLVVQNIFDDISYTCASYLFPTVAILYLVHANPFDLETGAVTEIAFEDMVEDNYNHGHELCIMSLYLHEFDNVHKMPVEITTTIRNYYSSYIRNAVLFRITNGRLILAFSTAKNPEYENVINRMLIRFDEEYAHYNVEYKIVIGKTVDAISRDRDYVRFIQYVESKMKQNDVKFYDDKDIQSYIDYNYILSELEDIHRKGDLEDPRVLVYCQPVYNIKRRKYDTAEALMRLKLNRLGMVFPDQFIPLAEEHKLIHSLSKIILHKTCRMIKGLINMDYDVKRISVNFSVGELREDSFCDDVRKIVNDVGIAVEKVAIEITESSSESEFLMVKSRIMELKDSGIKFYLDDFGTGYSNFERIMELPFDIIKFDRSLVIASDKDKRSEDMVASLARMFSDMQYRVLYEGVENDADEERCIEMYANYLQGYKYSKPIPIEDLTRYFTKVVVEQALTSEIPSA